LLRSSKGAKEVRSGDMAAGKRDEDREDENGGRRGYTGVGEALKVWGMWKQEETSREVYGMRQKEALTFDGVSEEVRTTRRE
jgi:hypothetical protein